MKTLFLVLAFAALFSMTAFAGEWTGVISDAKCAASHADASEKSAACAQSCVKRGAAPVFVTSDNKVLKIDSESKEKVMPHVGHKVTVTGSVEGDTLKVDSIKM